MHLLDELAADVEGADAFVTQRPLLAGDGVVVEAVAVNVQRYVTAGLRPVQHYLSAVGVGDPAEVGGGHTQAGRILDVADEDEPSPVIHRRFELAYDGIVGVVGVNLQHPYLDAVAVGDVPARSEHRAVLQVAGDYLVAFLPAQAAEYDVQALGGVAGDQRLVSVGPQQTGGGAAGFFLYLTSALIDAGGGRPLLGLQRHPRLHRFGGLARRRPGPASVHVGQVL